MALDEFEQLVVEAADSDLKRSPLLRTAIYDVVKKEKTLDPKLVRDVLQLTRKLHAEYALPKDASQAPTAGDLLTAERLTRKLVSWTAALRTEEFRSNIPPFRTVDEAARYIEQTNERDLVIWRRGSAERSRAYDEIQRLADKHRIKIAFWAHHLLYQRSDSAHAKVVSPVPNTFLEKLARQTERLAENTGVSQDVLVAHVLTGLRPVLPRVRESRVKKVFTLPGEEQLGSRWETLTFFSADLTYKEFRQAYNGVREYMGSKRTKGFKYKDIVTLRLVEEEMGGPPQKAKMKFWQEAQRRYDSDYPGEITTPDGMKRRYDRLCKKLSIDPAAGGALTKI